MAGTETQGPTNGEAILRALQDVPEAVVQAGAVIEGLDRCLLAGFGRLGAEQGAALDALARSVAGTPLEDPIGRALAALRGNEFQPRHFAVLAAVRVAVQGARYDALRAHAAAALGRTLDAPAAETAPPSAGAGGEGKGAVLCDSARHWLMELAVTGFKQVDASTLAPFSATLENLQGDPGLGRLASLLSGFQQELLAALPIGHAAVPFYRWADLWSAAMVTSLQAGRAGGLLPPVERKVDGTLTVLGVDLRQHGCFVSAVVYALLEGEAPPRVVRVTLSSYKVDALQGREVWRCFAARPAGGKGKGDGAADGLLPLLKAVSEHVPLKVKGMTLLQTGDLLWDGTASEAGKPVDVFAVAAGALGTGAAATFPSVAPADRHPVQLAEPVLLQGLKVETKGERGLRLVAPEGPVLPIAESRLVPGGELTVEDVRAADTVMGLLRFDGDRWAVQPLAVRPGATKEKRAFASAFVGSDAVEVVTRKPKKGESNTLAVLQERAGRLLRKKS